MASPRKHIYRFCARTFSYAPYTLVSAFLYSVFHTSWYQKFFAAKYLDAISSLASLLDYKGNKRDLIAHCLVVNFANWRYLSFDKLSPQKRAHLLKCKGFEYLQEAISLKQPVILLSSHFGNGQFIQLYLNWNSIKVITLQNRAVLSELGIKNTQNLTTINLGSKFPLPQLVKLEKRLSDGATAVLAADGFIGTSGFEMDFLGGRRRFAASFADIALRTNAVVIPVFTSIAEKGSVSIEFLPPLDKGDADTDGLDRMKHLLTQYSSILETKWRQDPANVSIKHFIKHQEYSENTPGHD